MPSFIVRVSGQPDSHFPIRVRELVIGRGDDSGLLLPNVSVSRQHARVVVDAAGVHIQDLNSANGTLVNGQKIEVWDLSNGDELRVGKFNLVFLGDGRTDQLWNGRYIGYLPLYDPDYLRSGGDATFQMDAATLKRLQRETEMVDNARIWLLSGERKSYTPRENELSFGEGGDVKVTGRFTGGIVAVVGWNGRNHVLERRGRFAKIEVNGESVSAHTLRHGDRIRIGETRFRYDLPA
ncbi:MAG: FHA domain-containing protein [Myxococcota bacterium]|nr:FHA domain-containing protein [Myxococcota bacterium]